MKSGTIHIHDEQNFFGLFQVTSSSRASTHPCDMLSNGNDVHTDSDDEDYYNELDGGDCDDTNNGGSSSDDIDDEANGSGDDIYDEDDGSGANGGSGDVN